jgi:precorrin-4 methylase
MKRYMATVLVLMISTAASAADLHREFTLPGVNNEQAYKRVNDFMHMCHHGIRGFTTTTVTAEIYPERNASEVRAMFSGGMIPETITTQQIGADTHVAINTVHKLFKWDTKELDAAQHSIESGTLTCR